MGKEGREGWERERGKQGGDLVEGHEKKEGGVFDFPSDNYVHRLVQNKGDGKLVEVSGQSGLVCYYYWSSISLPSFLPSSFLPSLPPLPPYIYIDWRR